MANFARPTFGRAFTAASTAKTNKKLAKTQADDLEERKRQAVAKDFADSLIRGRDETAATLEEITDVTVQAVEKGADPAEFAQAHQQILDSYLGRIAQLKGMAVQEGKDPSLLDDFERFGEEQKTLFDTAISSASIEDTSENFETLSVEELAELERVSGAKLPEGALVQRSPDGEVSLAFDPTENPSTIEERRRTLLASGLDRPEHQ